MYHLRRIKVLLVTCMLASASLWAQDTKISLENATAKATSDQGGDEAASSAIDGDYSKFWHSQWSWGAVFNSHSEVELTIALSEVTLVDYVRYIPRQNNNNGHWGEVEVFYSPSTTGTSFTSVGTFNLNKADIPHDFFLNGTEGVSCGQIKFTIRSGSNNHATAAEIEMYQLDKAKLNAFAQCFSDAVYTELKPGVTSSSIADADVRALVQSMQSDPTSYKKFRVGEYEAYETIWTLQQRLKTKNPYSRYENPTGVYFESGQTYLVAVSGIEGYSAGLKVKNWYTSESVSTYSLRNGLNYITATTEGNVFVNYYTDDYAKAPNVKVHFINAPVIGYWNQEMDNSDWVEILEDKAADDNRIIITQSEHAQLAFPISAWKTHCPTDVKALMELYQNVQWALRDMMGLEKYGYQTKNRQLFYAITSGLMAAGAEGAYCPYASLGSIMNVDGFDFWGVGHEWGHNNQIDPGFHWSGCGETTNNIYASWAQYHFTANRDAEGNPTVLRLEDENTGIDEYSGMRGGRMQVYFEEALRKGVAWQLQDGPDYHGVTPETKTVTGRDADGNDIGQVTTTSRNYDHFVKLTPFWQLNLWGNLAGKCPDIITDVIHSIRTAENYTATYNTNGKQQINWMKLACDHAGIDLLPFFEKAGMLRPIHAYIEDYGEGWNIINEEMINELKQYVKTKGYPAFTEEINYINAHNMHIYRDGLKLKVTGMQGELSGDKLIVQHSVAQNAVAFETYNAQDELIRITMYGLGSNDEHSFTQVLFPSDAVYVMAVGYDGERQMVYKVRDNQELQALIEQTQALIDEVGTVSDEYEAQEVELSADNYYCNATYTASNNGDKFTSYEVLRDGNPSTYLHTDYSANAPSEDHYVRIDLGSGNELTYFNLNYRTRKEGYVCAPTKVTVEASNDDKTWVTLREVTSGLNTEKNQVNTIEELGDGTPYRYIRMKVLETSTSTRYFVLSEMGLEDLVYNVDLNDGYSAISTGAVVAAYKAVQAAQDEINGGKDYTKAYNELLNKYNALIAAREEMGQLDELRAPLLELIARTESLINSCGTVTYVPATYGGELVLQASNPNGNWYVSTNADHNHTYNGKDFVDGGGIGALVDDNTETYFHTRWGGEPIYEDHYIQVDMGEGVTIGDFMFSYTARDGSPAPTIMTIYGSNDGSDFSENIITLRKEWADDNGNGVYTSERIAPDKAYRYLRFVVTESNGPGTEYYYNHYFFGMRELDITAYSRPASYAVTLGAGAGTATEELLLETYHTNQEAKNAKTASQIQSAIATLQAKYDELNAAMNSNKNTEYTVKVIGGNDNGGVVYRAENYINNQIFSASVLLDESELAAISLDGYVAKSVTLSGTTITVTYNKVYTVNVVGGADGGVTYNETPYRNGEAFDAPQGFTVKDLSALDVDGYAVGEISLNGSVVTVTYKKIYTVNVSGVTGQGGVMFADESFAHNGAIHVLGTLDADQLTAVDVDGYAAYISIEGATVNVIYKMIYRVEVIGTEGGVTFEGANYLNGTEVHTLSAIELSQLTAVEVEGYLTTVTLDNRTIRVTYAKLIQDLSELRNYKAYHIRAKSGEGYFAWNSSITDTYVSLRGVTDWSENKLPSNESVANKYKESIDLSDKTVVWQIIKEGDSYYLYQPEKKSYVTRSGRDYMFTADKTALDGIRQNSGADAVTFGIHAGGGYSDRSTNFACIVTNEASIAVRNWTWSDHGSVLQIIENPYVYALDYAVKVVGNANGGVEFEGESYTHGMTLSATELLTGDDLTMLSLNGCESVVEVDPNNATITVTYTALNKTELINLIATTEALVNSASSYLGSSLNVTEALIGTINTTLTEARNVRDNSSVSTEVYDAALNELQEAYLQLQTAIAYATLPVQLTFDADSPVTYKITINRNGLPVLAYDENTTMVAVTEFKLGNKSHGWYFMATTDGKVRIMPYHDLNTTHALSTNSFAQAHSKVMGMAIGAAGYTQEWTITNENMNEDNKKDGWYNITTIDPKDVNTIWYFSNHSGVTQKMGFYNYPNDPGSLFKFEQADFSKSEAYYTLYNYYHGETKVASSNIQGGEAVGYYPIDKAIAYNNAYGNATNVLESATTTDDEYTNAYDALKAANEALELNMPIVGKYYVIRSAHDGYAANKLMYATGENAIRWKEPEKTAINPEALWAFTSDGYLENLQTGCAVNTNGGEAKLGDAPKTISIKGIGTDGQVLLTPAGGTPLHADQYGYAVSWGTYDENSASAWRIEEVDMSKVKHTVSISKYEHAGLYLNYPVTIPDGVKAYYLDGKKITIDNGVGSLNLTKIEDDVIPAKTAVILYAPHGNQTVGYDFVYTEAQGGEYNNLLTGSAYQAFREAQANHNYYVFGQKGGEIGLYKNAVKYSEDATEVGEANGTHYKMSANKILFDWDSSTHQVSSFRFRMGGQTTGMEDEVVEDNVIIYDLYGRRILEVITSGLYIVNGEKRYIQVR